MGQNMNEDFDLEKFVELFDIAMTSDNPTVRKAFKNLMIVAALVDSENTSKSLGPLKEILTEFRKLSNRVNTLEVSRYTSTPYTNGNVTINTNTPYYGIAPTYTSTTSVSTANMGYTITNDQLDKYSHIYTTLSKPTDE